MCREFPLKNFAPQQYEQTKIVIENVPKKDIYRGNPMAGVII